MKVDNFPRILQREIENDIVTGKLGNGDSFTEKSLTTRYSAKEKDISLLIQGLYRKGLVELEENGNIRIMGLPEAKITSVFQYAQKSRLKPSTVVRKVEIIPADSETAKKLMIEPQSPAFVQVRTRLINHEILANQYNYIPYEICPDLESIDLSHSSFQVTLEKEFHTVITRIHEDYFMAPPTRDDQEILQIDDQDRVLVIQRTSFSRNEMPVVFADIHVNPKLFHYVKDLWPKASSLVDKSS